MVLAAKPKYSLAWLTNEANCWSPELPMHDTSIHLDTLTKSHYYHYSTIIPQRCAPHRRISSFLYQVIVICLIPQIHSLLLTLSQTFSHYHLLKMSFLRKVISNNWNCLPTRDMLSGGKTRLSIGILGGARSSIRPKPMINLVTFPGRIDWPRSGPVRTVAFFVDR